jgi:hypothetical protein
MRTSGAKTPDATSSTFDTFFGFVVMLRRSAV